MIGPLGPGLAAGPPPDPRERLLESTRQLEAVFYQQMLQAMRDAAPSEGGLIETSEGEKLFRGLLDETVARLAAGQSERGPGMAMFRQMSGHLPPEEAAEAPPLGTLEHRNGVAR
ncbi:MAG: rod-binding protein [Gemmatimonadales bacterium]|nr:rod-binding protein [Gemmatimonadales bacterium]